MPPLNLYARVRISLCILHTRPRVQRAPGLPCALCALRGWKTTQKLGRIAPRECEPARLLSTVIARECGRSSIPETAVIEPRSRGVLDTPHARGMTTCFGAARCAPRIARRAIRDTVA